MEGYCPTTHGGNRLTNSDSTAENYEGLILVDPLVLITMLAVEAWLKYSQNLHSPTTILTSYQDT